MTRLIGGNPAYGFTKERNSHEFKMIWQRTMRRALEQTDLDRRFTLHDLRAKHATVRDEGDIQASLAL